jgi:preprotein translocase subunit SecG
MGLGTIIAVALIVLVILYLGVGGFISAVIGGGREAWDRRGQGSFRDIIDGSSRMMVLHTETVS